MNVEPPETFVIIESIVYKSNGFAIYGTVAPQTGESFWREFSHLDSLCFQIFWEQLAGEYPDNLNVVQLDNGRFHHSSSLKIPDNILLIF